jgi:16S rRNA (guanine527-N7)-methyltransferase
MPAPEEEAQLVVNKAIATFSFGAPPTLARYLSEVLEWNSVLALISRRDPLAACERLLFESLELGQLLDIGSAGRVADVGSGAGFPGLVWALMFPRLEVVLIERREKRALFLERTIRKLGATNVSVVARDLGDVSRETSLPGTFDLVTTVAVGDPTDVADDVERVLKSNGRFASTIAREAHAQAQVGSSLILERRLDGKFGCYAIYRRGVLGVGGCP